MTVDEGCATSHRLKWDLLSTNEVGRIAQHVKKGEGRKVRKDGVINTIVVFQLLIIAFVCDSIVYMIRILYMIKIMYVLEVLLRLIWL